MSDIGNSIVGDELYRKLVHLREENAKTLAFYERLYQQQHDTKHSSQRTISLQPSKVRFSEEEQVISLDDENSNASSKSEERDDIAYADLRDENSSVRRIRQMWDNFNLSDYYRRNKSLDTSNHLTAKEEEEDLKENERSGWRHRVTVPKPFKMTLRESSREHKRLCQLRHEFDDRLRQESEELNKKKPFKAQPAPAHIYLPLFDEIKDRMELKSQIRKRMTKEAIESMIKPFNFTRREEEKRRMLLQNSVFHTNRPRSRPAKQEFKANPVPRHIFDHEISNRLEEDEEYRKIRIKMRAMETLKKSSLPPRMLLAKVKNSPTKTLLQRSWSDDDLYYDEDGGTVGNSRSSSSVANGREQPVATATKPFHFETDQRPSRRQRARSARPAYQKTGRYIGSPLWQCHDFDQIIPSATNNSFERKKELTRQLLRSRYEAQVEKEMDEYRRRRRLQKMEKEVRQRLTAGSSGGGAKERRGESIGREQYTSELDGMRRRVRERPLLFEQATQTNARRRAEHKYRHTLKRHGIDEHHLLRTSLRYAADDARPLHVPADADSDYDQRRFAQSEAAEHFARQPAYAGSDDSADDLPDQHLRSDEHFRPQSAGSV